MPFSARFCLSLRFFALNVLILFVFVLAKEARAQQDPTVLATAIVDHPALNAIRKGIIDQLKQEGFSEKTMNWEYQSAQGSIATAAQIAQRFVGKNPNVIIAISTSSAQTIAATTKTLPIVYAGVTDPIAAKLVKDWGPNKGSNITGVSDQLPLEKQMALIRRILPQAKRLGMLYSLGEVNAVVVVKALEKILPQYGFTLILVPVSRTTDITQAVKSLIGKVDAIYTSTDNTIISAYEMLVKIANDKQIPLFAADTDSVSRGAIAALGINQYDMGRQAGKIAARILRGEKPGAIASEKAIKTSLVLNVQAAKKQEVRLPADLLAEAAQVIQ